MKERAAILFLCAGLLLCCAVGISMLFGCAGVALLVWGWLVQKDFPLESGGNAGGLSRFPLPERNVPPSAAVSGPRHVRTYRIARPSCLLFDQDAE